MGRGAKRDDRDSRRQTHTVSRACPKMIGHERLDEMCRAMREARLFDNASMRDLVVLLKTRFNFDTNVKGAWQLLNAGTYGRADWQARDPGKLGRPRDPRRKGWYQYSRSIGRGL
jgi:hypothetical protein